MHRKITRLALANMGDGPCGTGAADKSRERREWKAVIPKPRPAWFRKVLLFKGRIVHFSFEWWFRPS